MESKSATTCVQKVVRKLLVRGRYRLDSWEVCDGNLIVIVRCVSAVIVYGHLIAGDETAAGDDPQPGWDWEEHQEVVLGQAQVISKHI